MRLACRAELMAFEAATIWVGLKKLMVMADSLRAVVWAPERSHVGPHASPLHRGGTWRPAAGSRSW